MEDQKLDKIAHIVTKKLKAGKEEIPLNQPFPEELKNNQANENEQSIHSNPESVNAQNGATEPEAGSQPQSKNDTENHDSSNDTDTNDNSDDDQAKSASDDTNSLKLNTNKLMILFVTTGIMICVIGVVALIVISFLAGLICMVIGALVILFGVFAPFGY
jgi:cobalamin biosynthesis Mg chelatase CobN